VAFISFEGGEGTGKSTQLGLFLGYLESSGIDAIATREPGGAPGAEDIRKLLVEGEPGRWDAITETLLHFAARRDHLARVIEPALARGQWVVSDRFADSTYAYQGFGHGVDLGLIEALYRMVAGDLKPDLTLILDLDVDEGLRRATGRGSGEDRYENMDREFHERIRQGFLAIADAEPDRCKLIDAAGSEGDVQARIIAAAKARFPDALP
jgi:dTMP kinase|tara:strand:+ start:609 stop:1238 length:630 start_codon:yes stop_codon:yes gene_type:complete